MHRIALPDDYMSAGFHGINVLPQEAFDFRLAVARDQRHLPHFLGWIDYVEESNQLVGRHARSNLDADGVLQTAEIFSVSTGELASAVAYPEEVSRGVVPSALIAGFDVA